MEGIALIIGVDRLLDMMRTAVNVAGRRHGGHHGGYESEDELDMAVFEDPDA